MTMYSLDAVEIFGKGERRIFLRATELAGEK